MERVVAYAAAGTRITANDLSPELGAGFRRQSHRAPSATGSFGPRVEPGQNGGNSLKEATALFEKRLIEEALERSGNSLSRAARELGLSRRGLHLKISQLGIVRSAGTI
jgi:DNA-binding NtrC family response regulator